MAESNWTPRFFDELSRRRGYDLRHHLPALFGADDADRTSRVLSDYRETISDLLLDQFTLPQRRWANAKGSLIRNQAHGSPANILDLYAASDIPEQEGTDLLAVKLASSAAHVMGRRLTAAETVTWINEHFLGTLGEVKAAVDLFFLGGVNHNCYHGTAFAPPGEPWPGLHFYASIELNPSNPIWRDFPVLNACVFPLPGGGWRMWYNNERDRKSIYFADSPDLFAWTDRGKTSGVGERPGEGPFVFQWKGRHWMVVDVWRGLGVYWSDDLLDWRVQTENPLAAPGNGADDGVNGGHASVVLSGDRAFLFYFTHPGRGGTIGPQDEDSVERRRSSIQVVELHERDGMLWCDRDAPRRIVLIPPTR